MSPPVLTCRLTDSLSTAAQLMWEQDCGSIPVTDDEGRLVGIVTDRDIFCHATEPRAPRRRRATPHRAGLDERRGA